MNISDASDLRYQPLTCRDLPTFARLYDQRHNLCCESSVLDGFMWRRAGHTIWTTVNDECLLMIERIGDTSYAGSLPFCPEEKLGEYFLLQQRYFNEVLHHPHQILYADEAGKNALESAGLLDGYEVTERENLADYLYDAEALRTLAGRKLSKKRNHIHKFEAEYGGRWEYCTLTAADKDEVLALFDEWAQATAEADREAAKSEETGTGSASGEGTISTAGTNAGTAMPSAQDADTASPAGADAQSRDDAHDPEGEEYINMEYNCFDRYGNVELELEHDVIVDLFDCPEYLRIVRAGGIRIDGRLRAFSIGCYNAFDKMAIINIEKAIGSVNGLYPVLSQQFLLHEFPDAVLVNREDDAGDPGLRQSKLSYFPSGYARKYLITQRELP